MTVVEDQRVLPLHQAGRLQLRKPVEALLVDRMPRLRASSGVVSFSTAGLAALSAADGREIALESRAIERGLVQVLRGANECAGATAHGVDQRFEIAAGFRRQEDQRLLRVLRAR